jgi:hypothetical protein
MECFGLPEITASLVKEVEEDPMSSKATLPLSTETQSQKNYREE